MRAQPTRFDNRSWPREWSALLSLLALLVLVVSPLCRCVMAEMSHEHSHSGVVEQTQETTLDDHHHDDGTAHHQNDGIALSSLPEAHVCCCDSDVPDVVLSALSPSAVPDASSWVPDYTPATLPVMQDVFALTNFHGRDGPPPNKSLLSQFSSSSLLGRAPPASV